MHVAIITTESVGPTRTGGIATFTFNLARLLKRHTSDKVTIVYAGPVTNPPSEWLHLYKREQIDFILVNERHSSLHYPTGFGQEMFVQRAESAFAKLPKDVDVVYLQENGATGFHLVRSRRFNATKLPVTVTMMHGSRDWVLETMEIVPDSGYYDLSISFMEQYGIQYSDFVLSNSQYLLDWVIQRGWKLPDRVHVMGLPFLPEHAFQNYYTHPAASFSRLIFFGRLETRKGFELFIETLLYLLSKEKSPAKTKISLYGIQEIVLLGREDVHRYGTARAAGKLLEAYGLKVTYIHDLDTLRAQQYLLDHAADSLVVIPSLAETLGYTVIETSLLPGINAIYANAGGIPEVIGTQHSDQLFEPNVIPFARKLEVWLQQGPRADRHLGQWDYATCNARWLSFHQEACALALSRKTEAPISITEPTLIDICVPYDRQHSSLPEFLQMLATQNAIARCTVTVAGSGVVQAGETDNFQHLETLYRDRGWRFVRLDDEQGTNAARNAAASSGHAPYLLFLSADCLLAPNTLERFIAAGLASGDDCLTCFTGELTQPLSFDQWDQAAKMLKSIHIPLGNAPVAGMLANVFGQQGFLVRRAAFEALNGFSTRYRYFPDLPNDDYAFLTVLSLNGYQLDVIPELLLIKNGVKTGSANFYQREMRVQSLYANHLKKIKMESLIPLLFTTHVTLKHLIGVQQMGVPGSMTDAHFFHLGEQLIPLFENPQWINSSTSEELTRNLHDPAWVAYRIPWCKLILALFYKLRKQFIR
jgi:glycosyltransferase involved in cell wall biosynthesis